jgi:hypothetical protein
MITAAETQERMNEDPRWWKIALMDFVDDFRFHKDPAAIAKAFIPSDEQRDAAFSAVIETLCDELNLPIPSWLREIPASREPFFVSGVENLKATALVESPVRFRIRNVFVMENFLSRV